MEATAQEVEAAFGQLETTTQALAETRAERDLQAQELSECSKPAIGAPVLRLRFAERSIILVI